MRYGSFETTTMLGRGGMGVVWRARHDSGEEVALKVVHPAGDFAKALRSLRREVQAIAALNHRGIVHVLDMGESDAQGEGWFAMEIAEGGTFEETSASDFPELARLLFDVLDALGYAHARGIIHRDIKPSNILLSANHSGGWRCVLTDFGIAHIALDPDHALEELTRATAGTPAYMAPEQFHGDWRSYGPWTDLYALGCLAYELLTGRPPFLAASALETAMLHISEDLPTPVPMFEAPPGFTAWLRRMTQKDPADRFRCAADASWGLVQVIGGDPRFAPAGTIAGKRMVRGTVATMTYDAFATQALDREAFSRVLQHDADDLDRAIPVVQPPVPYHVVEPTETPDRRLFGAGLNLFGLRQTPLVGRVAEREVLWSALRRACNEGLQTLLLQGEPGIGRSKLVQWLSMRAEEVGAADIVTVHHSETGSGAHGMGAALAANLGLQGLRGRELARRVEAVLQGLAKRTGVSMPDMHDRVAEFAQLLVPEPIEGYPQITFENPRQRYSALTWIVALMSMDRPVLLAVEDGNWAWDTLGFVRHLIEYAPQLRVMVLVVSDPQIACPIARSHRHALMEWPHATTLNLSALSTREHEALVRAVAPLDRTAAARVVAATSGRPGHVIARDPGFDRSASTFSGSGRLPADRQHDAVTLRQPVLVSPAVEVMCGRWWGFGHHARHSGDCGRDGRYNRPRPGGGRGR
ncbi:MAG: serine/threonine-protein kinase [bacterium]